MFLDFEKYQLILDFENILELAQLIENLTVVQDVSVIEYNPEFPVHFEDYSLVFIIDEKYAKEEVIYESDQLIFKSKFFDTIFNDMGYIIGYNGKNHYLIIDE